VLADHDPLERAERRVCVADGGEHVAAAVRGAHERADSLVVLRCRGLRIVGQETADARRVAGLDEREDCHGHDS
jgi:hypothetical protein